MSATESNPIRFLPTLAILTVALLGAFSATAQSLPPAPFKPLPVGTVLDYGSFRCTVERSADFVHSCRGPKGESADFFGKFVPFNRIAGSGYGSGMDRVHCEGYVSNSWIEPIFNEIESIDLSTEDRQALQTLWPLETGKKVSFRRNFRPLDGRVRSTIEVTGTRTVNLGGRPLPVYEVRGRTTNVRCLPDSPRGDIVVRFDESWLYAPDLGAVVRYRLDWRDDQDQGRDFAYDLKEIILPKSDLVAQVPPAPYTPLPAGTELDYGSWKCTVNAAGDFAHGCSGSQQAEARYYGKLVPFGRIPDDGYGTNQHVIHCSIDSYLNPFASQDIKSVVLSGDDQRAIRGLWPLSIGKSATFRRNYRPLEGRAKSTIRVTGTKTVTVLGRQRPVYVLTGETTKVWCASRKLDPVYRGFQETWWYAPDLAAVVHYDMKWSDDTYPNTYSYDLKSIKPPRPAAIAQVVAPSPPQAKSAPSPAPSVQPPAPILLDKAPPSIDVPSSLTTDSAVVRLSGKVRDASRVVELTLNGAPVPVAVDGSFSVSRGIGRGDSTLVIAAIDEWGNRTTRRVAVHRTAAPRPQPANPFADLHFGNYHALVIGNNRYRALPALRTAESDARAVSELLRTEYGFDVTLRLNATRSDVIDGLAALRARLTANDSLLVYYAGHGVIDRVTEQGYWLPVDAERDSPSNWVSTWDITNMLRAIRARHVMVVADSCYSGTLVRAAPINFPTTHERRAWIERVLGKRARTALVSGGLEPVLDGGGGGKHSVFARAFLEALRDNRSVMEGEALFDAIKRPVALNANQTPQYSDIRFSGHDGGDFLFVRK